MKKRTVEDKRRKVDQSVAWIARENLRVGAEKWLVFRFENETLGAYGAVVIDNIPEIANVNGNIVEDIQELIRINGATNCHFFIQFQKDEFDSFFEFKGWIYHKSAKIKVESRASFINEFAKAYEDGLKQLFEAFDQARFALKLKKLAQKRMEKLSIDFE